MRRRAGSGSVQIRLSSKPPAAGDGRTGKMSLKRLGPVLVPLGTPACPVGLAPAGGPQHGTEPSVTVPGRGQLPGFEGIPLTCRLGYAALGSSHQAAGTRAGRGAIPAAGGCGGPRRLFLPRVAFSIIHTDVNREVTHSFMPPSHKVRMRVFNSPGAFGCSLEGGVKPRGGGLRWEQGGCFEWLDRGGWRLGVSDSFLVWG